MSTPPGAVRLSAAPAVATVAVVAVDLADVLAELVLACPAVAGLSGGPLGSAATYLAGRKVSGIRVGDDAVEVHPVLAYGATVGELARQVRRALAAHAAGRPIDIIVEDVHLPNDNDPDDNNIAPLATRPTPTLTPSSMSGSAGTTGQIPEPEVVTAAAIATRAPVDRGPTRPGRAVPPAS